MKLRTKLLLGYAGFVLALGVLGAWSARTLSQMSAVSGRIIAENYDSVVAAQDMKESLERQDSAARVRAARPARPRAARQVAEHRARFDAALDKAAAEHHRAGRTEIDRGDQERARRLLSPCSTTSCGASGDRTARVFRASSSRASTRSAPTATGCCASIRRRCAARPTGASAHRPPLVLHHAGAGARC